MSTTRILALGAVAMLLYFALSFGLQATFPRTSVGYETALTGRISATLTSGRHRSFLLNGRKAPRYEFDAFAQSQQPEGNSLSHYLRIGDVIRKPGRTTRLTVQRGDSIIQWVCPLPEAR